MSKIGLEFTETMHGSVKFNNGEEKSLRFLLTIEIEDVDSFSNDPNLKAKAKGHIEGDFVGNSCEVEKGVFNLFRRPVASESFDASKEMHYLLHYTNEGKPYTLFGYKEIEREDVLDVWEETTTLHTYIFDGHVDTPENLGSAIAKGVLRLTVEDFAKQMQTFKAHGGSFIEKTSALIKFFSIFAGNLWESYAPAIFGTDQDRWNEHIIPLQTLEGVRGCNKEHIGFNTDDGLRLSFERFTKKKSKNVVLLLHGLTTSTDMFVMPEHYNFTQYLLDHGFDDVWSLDWRGSGRFTYNLEPHRYSIDDMAYYDIPKAIEVIKDRAGEDVNIHVVCHCVGSLSFMASLAANKTSNISSVIANSVSLTPKVKWQSKLKIMFAPFLVEYIFGYPYLSPKMPYYPGPGFGRWMWWMERAIRSECKEPACHMTSFMWGWGFPACFEHRNIDPVTHRRLADLFGGTSVNYYRHIKKTLKNNELVSYKREGVYSTLPNSYLEAFNTSQMPPVLLISGANNHIFPGSNKLSYEKLKEKDPNCPVEYKEFENYGHQDVFMGKFCDREVFPELVSFIKKHAELEVSEDLEIDCEV